MESVCSVTKWNGVCLRSTVAMTYYVNCVELFKYYLLLCRTCLLQPIKIVFTLDMNGGNLFGRMYDNYYSQSMYAPFGLIIRFVSVSFQIDSLKDCVINV